MGALPQKTKTGLNWVRRWGMHHTFHDLQSNPLRLGLQTFVFQKNQHLIWGVSFLKDTYNIKKNDALINPSRNRFIYNLSPVFQFLSAPSSAPPPKKKRPTNQDGRHLCAMSQMKASWPAKAEMVMPKGKVGEAKLLGTAMPPRWKILRKKFLDPNLLWKFGFTCYLGNQLKVWLGCFFGGGWQILYLHTYIVIFGDFYFISHEMSGCPLKSWRFHGSCHWWVLITNATLESES